MEYRNEGRDRTLILVHGLSGESAWTPLVRQLAERPELQGWDVHSFEYVSTFRPRWVRFGLVRSPNLKRVADAFVTHCKATLNRYGRFAILAHSAGGLIALRALLDSEWLRQRTSHVALLGAPVGGVPTARWLRILSPQYRDLATGSAFLEDLQERLRLALQETPPFAWRVVGATDDGTVTGDSVFHQFPESVRRVVPGNHLSMIQPERRNDAIVGVIVNLLSSKRIFLSYVREDETRAMDVYRALQQAEFTPWIDRRSLMPGAPWAEEIQEALKESHGFLVFLSAASIAKLSKEGQLKQEVDTAIRMQGELSTSPPFLVPVRLENVDLPAELARFQWYDLFSGSAEGLAGLLARITLNPT